MKKQKKRLLVLLVCLVGSFALPPAESSGSLRDVTSIILYETGGSSDLQFKIVDDVHTKKAMDWIAENYKNKKFPDGIREQNQLLLQISKAIELPPKFELLFHFVRDQKTDKLYPRNIMTVERTTTLGGKDISEVWVDHDSYDTPVIDFLMSSRGADEFQKMTGAENRGKRLAIIIGNKIRSAPTIEEQIVGGSGQITGDFSKDEAEEFVHMLMNSSAPFRIE